jgi:Kinesin motor domain
MNCSALQSRLAGLAAGKTFTMEGVSDKDNPELRGIMLNVFDFIFDQIQEENQDREYLVYVSYLEIYNEEIKDLLAKDSAKKLQLKEGKDKGVYVNGLSKVQRIPPAAP